MPPRKATKAASAKRPRPSRTDPFDHQIGAEATPRKLSFSSTALALTDGALFVGSITERDGKRHAFDIAGHHVGTFQTRIQAARTIPKQVVSICGGSDGARTRDLRRDRPANCRDESSNVPTSHPARTWRFKPKVGTRPHNPLPYGDLAARSHWLATGARLCRPSRHDPSGSRRARASHREALP
jgi:hypothetical protein